MKTASVIKNGQPFKNQFRMARTISHDLLKIIQTPSNMI